MVITTIDPLAGNPLLAEWNRYDGGFDTLMHDWPRKPSWGPPIDPPPDGDHRAAFSRTQGAWVMRKNLCRRYSWAIPDGDAIALLRTLSPIVEVGAGTGYWAWLLRLAGATVYAYDHLPPDGLWRPEEGEGRDLWRGKASYYHNGAKCWTEVEQLDARAAVAQHPDCTLFLCWPPMTDMASEALHFYQGNRVVYVGESEGGCTATDEFHASLEKEWRQTLEQAIPQWVGIHDRLTVWERA